MICRDCSHEVEAEISEPDEHHMEAARFFFEAIVRAMKGHHGDQERWCDLREETRRAMGHAVPEFKKRYVCAG